MFSNSLPLKLFSWLAAIVLFLPIFALIIEALSQSSPSFEHLANTVLWDYTCNSLLLVIGVCFFALFWGVPSAWLISRYDFFGRRFFRSALLLPMAMPAYIVAYVYTDIFDYSGVVQRGIREIFGFSGATGYWFFDMRTMGGAIFVLSLVFSPYVYWICRLNFATQCQTLVHSSRLLGAGEWRTFFRVVLPMSRPALAISCSLVAMETLADFGTVSYFSVWNLTTAIYDTWLSFGDLSAAAKLACLLLLFIVVLVLLEKYSRRRSRYHRLHRTPLTRIPLSGKAHFFASAWCFLIIFLGFILPIAVILYYALGYLSETDWLAFFNLLRHSLSLAVIVGLCAVIIALAVQLLQRLNTGGVASIPKQLSNLGYAMPGTVLAIGVLIIITQADHMLSNLRTLFGGSGQGLLLSGTLFAMGYAFLSRFSAIGIGTVESGMSKIPPNLDQTAYLFGYSLTQTVKTLFLPLLKSSLLTAFLLVFLESMKELSAAILLRPFNVETLATYVYQYMSAEEFEVAALPAVVMVLAGLPPIFLITASMDEKYGNTD